MSSRHHQLSHYFIWFTLKYHHLRCFSDSFCLKIFKIDIFQNWIKTLSFSVISSFNIFRESLALHCFSDFALLLYEDWSEGWEISTTLDSHSPTRRSLKLSIFFVTVFTVCCVRFHMSSRHHLLSHYFTWFTHKYHHLRCFFRLFFLQFSSSTFSKIG